MKTVRHCGSMGHGSCVSAFFVHTLFCVDAGAHIVWFVEFEFQRARSRSSFSLLSNLISYWCHFCISGWQERSVPKATSLGSWGSRDGGVSDKRCSYLGIVWNLESGFWNLRFGCTRIEWGFSLFESKTLLGKMGLLLSDYTECLIRGLFS